MYEIVQYLDGLKMCVIQGDKGMSAIIKLVGIHEGAATTAIMKYLREGMTVIDIGANIGYYAFLEARAVNSSGRVYAIEPSPESYAPLEEGRKLNEFSWMSTHQIAIGTYSGEILFNLGHMSNSSNVIDDKDPNLTEWAHAHLANAMRDSVMVPCETIDSFVDRLDINNIDILRMDVEGYELEIMKHADTTLSRMNDSSIIFMETHPLFFEDRSGYVSMTACLNEYGFKPHKILRNGDLEEIDAEIIAGADVLHVFWVR